MVIKIAPSRLPMMLPLPPNKEVPPRMTAAIASSSNICAILPLEESMRPINTMAAKAQQRPETTYTPSLYQRMLIPTWRAPISFEPIA